MVTVDIDKLTALLIRHEGLRLKPYKDTMGKLTIGVGRNLVDVGITKNEASVLLGNDIGRCFVELKEFDFFEGLSEIRKMVLMDMCFNLGIGGLKKFKMFLSAIKDGDYTTAGYVMLNNLWSKQVGNRAVELAYMMQTDRLREGRE